MEIENRRPATGSIRSGPSICVTGKRHKHRCFTEPNSQTGITFQIDPGGPQIRVTGRVAQTLNLLLAVGPRGFTPGEASPLGWARRSSDYVFRLRRLGVAIATISETMGDCRIGRYVLQSRVALVTDGGAKGA
jgi:hypothetical protein